MEMTGERRIEAPRQTVWEGLNDPEVLRASIPGCESVERTAEDAFQARVALKIGPMAAKFTGKVQLSNINAPAGYTISGEGNGGAMGFAKGGADVSLEEVGPSATLLKYQVKAQVGGKMAQLGARLIDSTAKQMADQFFDRFAATVSTPAASEPTTLPDGTPVRPSHTASLPEGAVPTPAPGTEVGDATPVERLGAATLVGAGLAEHSGETPPGGRPAPVSTPAGHGHAAPPARSYAKPVAAPAPALSVFSLLPEEVFGLPLLFWGGSAVFMVVLFLLFVLG
ncbi:carbon monoxide dehydrogenase [Pseudoroseomonas deserti]|uniref:Carbon monoxide dehydrogenase n=1 Tax=Teichococcus deserti TaxID=1817963 RepID=A0A1V2H8Z9_9PROT|nr:carbon monoxide dehydrogenase subunit G [Pseudoroseomonas deserti]ONG58829.1 carbon monoxide dehydrogenase [Pseudoroseomonas deserti]